MKIGTLGHALTGLLASREMTGYELAAVFDQSLANVWSASHGQIYPELARLQSAGLIELTAAGARGSKRYRATDAGRAAVRRWLEHTEPVTTMRSEPMLRVFFFWLLEPETAAVRLREAEASFRTRLTGYRAIAEEIAAVPNAAPPQRWSRIALEAGLRYEEAMADWARWAAETVAAELARTP